ncbi:MAG: methionyl-tRNA formyltransferase, partial [Candidatus Thioglobus sp.]|nr:methionyl-tRNA formyltransferase [Candidatus Thioglobus sp.]
MKIIFAGTPGFSVSTLEALIDAGHEIVGVYCQPDRPKGRGRILTACPVKEKALELDLTVYQPENLRDSSA